MTDRENRRTSKEAIAVSLCQRQISVSGLRGEKPAAVVITFNYVMSTCSHLTGDFAVYHSPDTKQRFADFLMRWPVAPVVFNTSNKEALQFEHADLYT